MQHNIFIQSSILKVTQIFVDIKARRKRNQTENNEMNYL